MISVSRNALKPKHKVSGKSVHLLKTLSLNGFSIWLLAQTAEEIIPTVKHSGGNFMLWDGFYLVIVKEVEQDTEKLSSIQICFIIIMRITEWLQHKWNKIGLK